MSLTIQTNLHCCNLKSLLLDAPELSRQASFKGRQTSQLQNQPCSRGWKINGVKLPRSSAHSVFSVAAEPTVQPEIDISSVEGRNATVRWRLPPNHGVSARTATGFLVQLKGPPPNSQKLREETTLLNVLSTKFHNLEYQQDYIAVVRLINCGSRGPPSKPYQFCIHSQGN